MRALNKNIKVERIELIIRFGKDIPRGKSSLGNMLRTVLFLDELTKGS
jgi:hypothetical protein